MTDPLSIRTTPLAPPAGSAAPGGAATGTGTDFTSTLREQLDKVSQVQSDADAEVRKFLTGQSDGMTEVLTAARKAQVAFSLLMEIRNKLVEAYQELQNMRI